MVNKKSLFALVTTVMVLMSTSCTRNATLKAPRADRSGEIWADQTNIDISETDKNITSDEDSAKIKEKIVPRIAFPVAEYNHLAKKGSATVRGSIYIDDGYGAKIYGKNTRLYLNPVTSYSRQWYEESYLEGYKLTKADARLYNYLKFTTSNEAGKFAFFGIPSGRYYVIGSVTYNGQKIRIADEISVRSGSSVETVLTRSVN